MSRRRKAQGPRIHRATKNAENPFTIILNRSLRDQRLTWEARGILGYILSKPDDWRINVNDLVNQGVAGRDKIYRILNELISFGYLQRITLRTEDGKFAGYEIIVYEDPQTSEENPIRFASTTSETTEEQPNQAFQEMEAEPNPEKSNSAIAEPDSTETEKAEHTKDSVPLKTETNKNGNISNNNSDLNATDTDSVDPEPVVVVLISHGLSSTLATQFAQQYPEGYLMEKVAFLEFEIARGVSIGNSAGWLRKAIEQDYARPAGYKAEAEIEIERALETEMRAIELQNQELQRVAHEEAKKAAEAAEMDQRAKMVEELEPTYGTTEELLDCWAAGQTYVANYMRGGYCDRLLSALDQTVLLSFQDGHAQIGVWGIPAHFVLKPGGKAILTETLAYAKRDYLDGCRWTFELILMEGATE